MSLKSFKICKKCELPDKEYRIFIYKNSKVKGYKNKNYKHESLICEDCRKENLRKNYADKRAERLRVKKEYWKINEAKLKLKSKANMIKAKEILSDHYIRNRLRLRKENATPEVIEAKRLLMQLNRLLRAGG